jgi:hypothetical protein
MHPPQGGHWIRSLAISILCFTPIALVETRLEPSGAIAASPAPSPQACPSHLDPLITKLLQDLPSYANRVRIRAGLERNYVLFAGKPDFQPLPLSTVSQTQDAQTQQVFFTTLIRRYERNRVVYHQEHHWLFLAPSPTGWRLVMMYSILAPYPSTKTSPLPPRNSSEGSIAQAIRDWLRDCRTGNRHPTKS